MNTDTLYYDISTFRESKMAKRLRLLRVRYRLQAELSTVAEKEALTSRIPQVRQLLRPSGSFLVDNSTLLNAMCDAVERKPTQLLVTDAPTEWPRRVAACNFVEYVVINFLCMFIYDFIALISFLSLVLSIYLTSIWLSCFAQRIWA